MLNRGLLYYISNVTTKEGISLDPGVGVMPHSH